MNLKPLSDYIVIEPKEMETKSSSGIILPDSTKEKPQIGVVLAVGPGKKDEDGKPVKVEIKEGDSVMYKKWAGTETKVDGKELILVREEDLLAIVKS
jgi:chaperonin GroES